MSPASATTAVPGPSDRPDRAPAVPTARAAARARAVRIAAAALTAAALAATAAPPAWAAPAPPGVAGGGGLAGAPMRGVSGDVIRAEQWQLADLDVPRAWAHARGDGVTVAVIDSGVEADHPDLRGQVLPGLDLVDPGGDGDTDLVGHGTTVAGLIAGRDDDADGVVGIAPRAKILPVRVLDRRNRYDDALIVARAVRWAVDQGASVINLSLGGSGSSPALAAALDYAFARDVVVVACTGNVSATSGGVWYPAREPGVVAVAGTQRGDRFWPGSITGRTTVVSAPAANLVGARPGRPDYWRVQGTSFAAPMVAATAALLRSRWPRMSAGDVVNRIIRTARDRGAPGRDDEYGFGVVDPVAALTRAVPAVDRNPLDDDGSPGVARLGDAPRPGEDPARDGDAAGAVGSGARVSGANAGAAVPERPDGDPSLRWWLSGALLVLALTSGVWTVRRFRDLR